MHRAICCRMMALGNVMGQQEHAKQPALMRLQSGPCSLELHPHSTLILSAMTQPDGQPDLWIRYATVLIRTSTMHAARSAPSPTGMASPNISMTVTVREFQRQNQL